MLKILGVPLTESPREYVASTFDKAFWVLAVLKCHIFVGTRKKTKQCFRLARLFDAVTAKRGCFKTVPGSALLCLRRSGIRQCPYIFRLNHRQIALARVCPKRHSCVGRSNHPKSHNNKSIVSLTFWGLCFSESKQIKKSPLSK